jgi:hypothetical protein
METHCIYHQSQPELTYETCEDNLENNNWKTQSLINSMLKDQIDIKIALN